MSEQANPIEVRGFGPNELEQTMQVGFFALRGALSQAAIQRVMPPSLIGNLWRPYDAANSRGWQKSIVRHTDEPFSRFFNPGGVELIRSVRETVRQAGLKSDQPGFEVFGENGTTLRNNKKMTNSLGLRYYRLVQGARIFPHRDPPDIMGLQFGFVLNGTRRYAASPSYEPKPEILPEMEPFEAGDAFVQLETRDPDQPEVTWLASRPWHEAFLHEDSEPRLLAIVSWVRLPYSNPALKTGRMIRDLYAAIKP